MVAPTARNSGMPASANIGSTEPRSWRRKRLISPTSEAGTDAQIDEPESFAMDVHPRMTENDRAQPRPQDPALLWRQDGTFWLPRPLKYEEKQGRSPQHLAGGPATGTPLVWGAQAASNKFGSSSWPASSSTSYQNATVTTRRSPA